MLGEKDLVYLLFYADLFNFKIHIFCFKLECNSSSVYMYIAKENGKSKLN